MDVIDSITMMEGSKNETLSDEDLMLNYQQGNAAAFEVLYQRHKGGVYRYLLAKCYRQEIAEELFQDVWMKLIAARDRYEVRAKFTTYIYQLAHNHFIDYYRKTRTDVFQQKDQDADVEQIVANGQRQADETLDMLRQTETLSELIDNLPDEQREAFMLKEEAGLTVAEIAEVTGVSAEAAKSRLRYAVKKLRTGLKENG
ncbi:MAG: RNA polymerase sigma-70 factor (ECF subfamily) [Gammaproteobacteria bacterium]|jgi:RNA polymerase sigma-70 factor (ECF subfamily)